MYTDVPARTHPDGIPHASTSTYWQYMPVPEIPGETLLWCYRSCIIQVHPVFPASAEYRESTASPLGGLVMRALLHSTEYTTAVRSTVPASQPEGIKITNNRIPGQSL